MKNTEIRPKIRIISYITAVILVLGITAAVNGVKAKKYKNQLELTRQRSLMSLTESLDSITTSLLKCEYCLSGEMLGKLAAEMGRNASQAKSVLSSLECPDDGSQEIYRFLSQVGAYTTAIAENYDTTNRENSLSSLYEYSKKLSDAVEKISDNYNNGEMSFEQTLSTLSDMETEGAYFTSELYDAQQTFTDYPVLIYDGPFSEAQQQPQPAALQGKKLINDTKARQRAEKILNSSSVVRDGDEEGEIELYCFSSGTKTVGITKYGGMLCYMLCSGYASQEAVERDEAVEAGRKYLEDAGYKNMKSTYYSVYDGICTVNYAYCEKGVIYYPDLIKVGISLDTGEVCELDARGYLMNHTARDDIRFKISLKEVKNKKFSTLSVKSVEKSVIPVDEKEIACYELLCADEEKREALVYINAETGVQEQILLLLHTDSGTLTK